MAENENPVAAEKPAEGTVHKTSDYGLFKYIESNRTINKNHVQHLIQSFENNPELVQTRPILVNEKMQIIDGQHRLQACQTLRTPVYYMVANGTNVESAQLMNALQKGWGLIDFARSYALNNENPGRAATYKKFLQLFEEYKIPISQLISFCEQRNRRNSSAGFKKGELEIKDEEITRNWLNMMEEIMDTIDSRIASHSRYALTSALFVLFKSPDYDHERMIKKLHEVKLEQQVDRASYLRVMENIYNHKLNEDNQVRFF